MKECRLSTSKSFFFILMCAGKKRLFGYDDMKVGDAIYFCVNVKKVMNHSYEKDCSRCDEYLDED